MIKLILMIVLILTSSSVLAAQEFGYIPGNKIRATISASNLNRIEFAKVGIAQIIGNEGKYKIISDSKAQNIFLLPKVPAHKTLEFAIIDFSGNVADLLLKVEDIEGQVIKISTDNFYNDPLTPLLKTEEQEIAKMIRSMVAGNEDKYYVSHIKRKIDSLASIGLSVEQDRIYRYGKLIGARLVVKNRKAKGIIHLKEADFSNLFDFCLATAIQKTVLPPKAKGYVWIVAREQDND